jgi:cytochrome P450
MRSFVFQVPNIVLLYEVHGFAASQSFVNTSTFSSIFVQAGPQICLGKDSAVLQLKMATSILCRFFKFQVFPGFPVKFKQMSTLLLAGGLRVTITKRIT